MKLLLTEPTSQNFTFSPSFVEKCLIPLSAGISILQNSNSVHNQTDVLNKRLQYFKEIFPQKEWILNTEFCFYDPESPKVEIAVEGELLKVLHDIFYYGSNNEHLHVSIQATYSSTGNSSTLFGGGGAHTQGVILAKDMNVDSSNNVGKHFRYCEKGIPLPELKIGGDNWDSSLQLNWKISVELKVNDLVDLTGLLPQISEKNAKILEEKLFCDFEIISSDGVSIPCHKAMLSTSSDMFKANCEGKLNEPSKNQMTMDLGEESINALLEFIYCGIVQKPMTCSSTAFELFQAGHKYGIVGLEPVIVAIFLQKSSEWYDVEIAFDLLRFLVNYEGNSSLDLRKKVIETLAMKSVELNDCTLVKETFIKQPTIAIQLFAMMAQELKNKLTIS